MDKHRGAGAKVEAGTGKETFFRDQSILQSFKQPLWVTGLLAGLTRASG